MWTQEVCQGRSEQQRPSNSGSQQQGSQLPEIVLSIRGYPYHGGAIMHMTPQLHFFFIYMKTRCYVLKKENCYFFMEKLMQAAKPQVLLGAKVFKRGSLHGTTLLKECEYK